MSDQCGQHEALDGKIGEIADAVTRLEAAQNVSACTQVEMAANLAVMTKTMLKLEDTNIHLAEMRGKQLELETRFIKSEKEHDDLYNRIRGLEKISANPRLNALEAGRTKTIWGGVVVVGLAFVATIIKAVWK